MTLVALVGTATGTAKETARLCFFKSLFSVSEIWFYPLIVVDIAILVIVLNIFG